MKRNIFFVLCAMALLLVVARPTSRVWAEDDGGDGDQCGSTVTGGDDDQGDDSGTTNTSLANEDQGDDDQGDDNGCGMVVGETDDENGDEIDDVNDDGTPDDDVDVEVDDTTPDGSTQTLVFQTNGNFQLTGLAKGKLRITVTRVHGGATTTRTKRTSVREHRTRHVHMKLRQPR